MLTIEDVAKLAITYRIKNNLTQKELAKKLNISNKTLCHIENEDKSVRNFTLQKVGMKLKENNF